jgi:drug/metabolite transporter (DMT)-like permease
LTERNENAWLRAMPAVFVLIWRTGFVVAKFGLPYAPPLTFLTIRYALSLLFFLVWIALARVAWPRGWQQWLHLAVSGVLIHAGYLGGVWMAIKAGMGSGLASLMVGLQPILTALWVSSMASKSDEAEKVSKRQWLGLALGLGGLVLVVSRKFGSTTEVTAFTFAAITVALLGITIGTLYQKRFVQPADVRGANAVQIAAAFVVTLPLALFETAVHRRAGLGGAGTDARRLIVAVHADSTRRGHCRDQLAVPGTALHRADGLVAVF